MYLIVFSCDVDARAGKTGGHVRTTNRKVVEAEKGPGQALIPSEILRKRLEVSVLFLQFHFRFGRAVGQTLVMEH